MTVRIRLLGSLAIERLGAPVALPARKTEALLALLALRPGVTFGREQVASLLWPDTGESQSRTSLRQALGHLRKHLPEAPIVASADRLHLDPRKVEVDSDELSRGLEGPPRARRSVLDLFRGPLLDGFTILSTPFDDWLLTERRSLLEHFGRAMEECMAALSAAGDVEGARRVGEHLIFLDPTRESTHAALIRLAIERGEPALARRHYTHCAELLRRHLDARPSAETEKLRQAIDLGAAPVSFGVPNPPTPDKEPCIAVLPFAAESEDPAAVLLGRALTEDVPTELSRFRQLLVIAPATIRALGSSGMNEMQIARESGARLLLSGRVRALGPRQSVTASLIDVATGLQLWAEKWQASGDDLFTVLTRLTRSVVSALALQIDEARLSGARKRPLESLGAYECWLSGLDCLRRGTPEADDQARGYFEQALRLDPGFARAHAGISLSHFNDWSCQAWSRWEKRERLAFESASRALLLDDGDHVIHYILGRILIYRRDFVLGERHLEQSLALNANDPHALMQLAVGFAQLGQPQRATELVELALRLNPKHPDWYYAGAAGVYFYARRLEASIELGAKSPDALVDSRAYLAAALAHLGRFEEARVHASRFFDQFRIKIEEQSTLTRDNATDWLLRVNPLARQQDIDYLMTGLVRAGIGRAG